MEAKRRISDKAWKDYRDMSHILTLRRALIVILLAFVGASLHYCLPQVDVVRIVGVEIKRIDLPSSDSGVQRTRDVYRIQTETLEGRPRVYRNEDVLFLAKFDSADLQAQMQSLAADKTIVALRHYGWRIRILSMFPNALKAWPVEKDYKHIPVFNILLLSLLAGGSGWAVLKLKKRLRSSTKERARRAADAARTLTEQEAVRERKIDNSRNDIEELSNRDG